jgi:hypothetical protein
MTASLDLNEASRFSVFGALKMEKVVHSGTTSAVPVVLWFLRPTCLHIALVIGPDSFF